jgi:hypothetical protein
MRKKGQSLLDAKSDTRKRRCFPQKLTLIFNIVPVVTDGAWAFVFFHQNMLKKSHFLILRPISELPYPRAALYP